MLETLSHAALVVLAGYLLYLLVEMLISRIWLRHVPHLPVRTDKTPPGSRATVVAAFRRAEDGEMAFGQIKLGGELWQACYQGPGLPEPGDCLEVVARDGLLLYVGLASQD